MPLVYWALLRLTGWPRHGWDTLEYAGQNIMAMVAGCVADCLGSPCTCKIVNADSIKVVFTAAGWTQRKSAGSWLVDSIGNTIQIYILLK